jgi:hypothetical protein
MGTSFYCKRCVSPPPSRLIKIWSPMLICSSFMVPALTGYELHTRLTIRDWLSKLESLQGSPLDISLYSELISFDNMGRVGYSKEWGVIKAGHANNMLSLLDVLTRPSGKLGRVAWLRAVGFQLKLSKEFREFEKLSKVTIDVRENVSTAFSLWWNPSTASLRLDIYIYIICGFI